MSIKKHFKGRLFVGALFTVIGVTFGWFAGAFHANSRIGRQDGKMSATIATEADSRAEGSANQNGGYNNTAISNKKLEGKALVAEFLKLDLNIQQQVVLAEFHDYQQLLSDPENYAAIKSEAVRTKLLNYQAFFKTQKISPVMRDKLLDLLAERGIEVLETAGVANTDKDSLSKMLQIQGEEHRQALKNVLGEILAERFENFENDKKYWKQMDTFPVEAAFEREPLSDDQKYTIIGLLAENNAESLADIKDKISPVLTETQQKAYTTYICDLDKVKRGKDIGKAWVKRSEDRWRQAIEKWGQK